MRNLREFRIKLGFICRLIFPQELPEESHPLEVLRIDCVMEYGNGPTHTIDSAFGCYQNASEPWLVLLDDTNESVRTKKSHEQRIVNQHVKKLATAARDFSKAMMSPKRIQIVWPDTLSRELFDTIDRNSNSTNIDVDTVHWRKFDKGERRMFAHECLENKIKALPWSWDWNSDGLSICDLDEEIEVYKRRHMEVTEGLTYALTICETE